MTTTHTRTFTEATRTYTASLQRVIDGDTFVAIVDLGFYVSCAVTVRVRNVNAPEHNTPEGPAATAWLRKALDARELTLVSHKDERSFARWVCDVEYDGLDLAEQMIAAGTAVAWARAPR